VARGIENTRRIWAGRLTGVAAALWIVLGLVASPAAAQDPGRWAETGRSTIPIYYYQGVTSDPETNLFFDGVYSGLYRTDSQLRETARNDDVIPPTVRATEGYNHIGDITWDAAEGGRILLPLECYYPGTPNGGNTCPPTGQIGTGSIGVADPVTLQWRYYVKLHPDDIKKVMWAEVSPDGSLLWTSSGNKLLAYDMADITEANAVGTLGATMPRPVRTYPNAVPPSGITGATFYRDGRLYVAGQSAGPFRVYSIDLTNATTAQSERLEIERQIIGESEGLDVFRSLGGVLHWQIQPYNSESQVPTYDPQNGTLLHFVPVAADVRDDDNDGVLDGSDNCAGVPNADQADGDGDGEGDVCDADDDNDNVDDLDDNCETTPNADQADGDGDGIGDACDVVVDDCLSKPCDDDQDGVLDSDDNCLTVPNADQANSDADADGDACDADDDNDGVADADGDNCPTTANSDQADTDQDGQGDACDADDDGDRVDDGGDNCVTTANPDQANSDRDRRGDACDPDDDNDGREDFRDNCRTTSNSGQLDTDDDDAGDRCDPDDDNDGVEDPADNCPILPNPAQANADRDARGDDCDADDDNDRVSDASELRAGTRPLDRDSDDDGLADGAEDRNGNGRLNRGETDPARRDTDRDRLTDGLERGRAHGVRNPDGPVKGTRPSRFHRDRDPGTRTRARRRDTDGDGTRDGREDANHNGRRDHGETNPRRADA